jgi:hypothetical protein
LTGNVFIIHIIGPLLDGESKMPPNTGGTVSSNHRRPGSSDRYYVFRFDRYDLEQDVLSNLREYSVEKALYCAASIARKDNFEGGWRTGHGSAGISSSLTFPNAHGSLWRGAFCPEGGGHDASASRERRPDLLDEGVTHWRRSAGLQSFMPTTVFVPRIRTYILVTATGYFAVALLSYPKISCRPHGEGYSRPSRHAFGG